jgi:hypothetical protein
VTRKELLEDIEKSIAIYKRNNNDDIEINLKFTPQMNIESYTLQTINGMNFLNDDKPKSYGNCGCLLGTAKLLDSNNVERQARTFLPNDLLMTFDAIIDPTLSKERFKESKITKIELKSTKDFIMIILKNNKMFMPTTQKVVINRNHIDIITEAKNIVETDKLFYGIKGELIEIDTIDKTIFSTPTVVYEFSLFPGHIFMADGIWVHNLKG